VKIEFKEENYVSVDNRRRSFGALIGKIESNNCPDVSFFGAVRPDMLPLVAARINLPAIFVSEDKQGNWHAVGCYANDLLTTVAAYLRAGEDEFNLLRRVAEMEIDINIIRCNNTTQQINNFLEILKLNNVSR
jgi:hypothetical protein